MKKYNSAFTLLELLVVIAIIGVLTALLVPSFSKMKERARCAKCASNLRQLQQAAVNYANDHNGRIPHSATYQEYEFGEKVRVGRGWIDWVDASNNAPDTADCQTPWFGSNAISSITRDTSGDLFSYLADKGDESVYLCPTFYSVCGQDDAVRSYGMNTKVSNDLYQNINGPTRTIMFAGQGFDKQNGYNYALEDLTSEWHDPPPPSDDNEYYRRYWRQIDGSIDWGINNDETYEHIGEYHGGRGNCVFVDGHVERVKYSDTHKVCKGDWGQ